MRRTAFAVLVPVLALSAALAAPAGAERAVFPLVDYRTESWFLPQSPGVTGGPAAGLFNPAAAAMSGRAGADFWWNDRSVRDGLDNYGFAFGSGLNFAMNTLTWGDARRSYKTYDYQLGLAAGSRRVGAGLAYRWAAGETDRRPRQDALVMGVVSRPHRRASVGASAAWSVQSRAAQYVFDVGVRPLGRDWLTLFADWAVNDDHAFFQDGAWSAGLEVRPVRGLHLGVRMRESATGDGTDLGALAGVTLGGFHAAAQRHWDDDRRIARNAFLLRSEPPFSGRPLGRPLFGPDRRYLTLDLQNRYLTYQKYRFFDDVRVAWLDLLRTLDAVRDDPTYDGVALNLAGFAGRPSLLWELRAKLAELQRAGKGVVVHTDRPINMVYYVAAVADEVTMDPQGMLVVPGFALSRSYLKGTLAKVGIGFQELRYFTYKSAAETFSRDRMSDADREQRQRVTDVLDATLREGIAAGRGVDTATVDRAVDEQALLMPQEAEAAGLIDAVTRWDRLGERLRERGIALTGELPGALRDGETWDDQWGPRRRIPVVFAVGPCEMDTGIRGRATSAYLRGLEGDPTVAAVVLRADSPGGDPLPSDLVADAVRRLRESGTPVIVSQGDVAASGGYWISMDGDEVLTTPVTLTGSIGVIGGWLWDDGVAGKLGVTSDGVSSSRHADLFSTVGIPLLGRLPRRAMDEDELVRVEKLIRDHYDAFVARVAEGRGLEEAEVRRIAEGRVWMGGDALAQGLCDRFGTLDDAIAAARARAGVPDWEEIALVEYPPRKLFAFPNLFRLPKLLPFGERLERWLATLVAPAGDPAPPAGPPALPGLTPLATEYLRTLADQAGRPVMMVAPDLLPDAWQRLD